MLNISNISLRCILQGFYFSSSVTSYIRFFYLPMNKVPGPMLPKERTVISQVRQSSGPMI